MAGDGMGKGWDEERKKKKMRNKSCQAFSF